MIFIVVNCQKTLNLNVDTRKICYRHADLFELKIYINKVQKWK